MRQNSDIEGLKEAFWDPLAVSVEEAARLTSSSRTELYEALQRKQLKAKKHGRRTVILRAHLEEYLASLPDYPGTTGE